MPNLTSLVFLGPDRQYIASFNGDFFFFPQIRYFEFHRKDHSHNHLSSLPFHANLREVFIRYANLSYDDFQNSIIKHPLIGKLCLNHLRWLNQLNVPMMANALPFLGEIDERFCRLSIDELIFFINHLKSRNIIRFKSMFNHTLTTYLSYLSNQWRGSEIIRDRHFPNVHVCYEFKRVNYAPEFSVRVNYLNGFK